MMNRTAGKGKGGQTGAVEASTTHKHNSAAIAAFLARAMPWLSKKSECSRNPAVSCSSTGQPLTAMTVETTSRVVPGVGDTTQRVNPARAFTRLLLPTLG